MKVLFVSSEVAPFAKTGGLADVAGALPIALAKMGIDARVVMPAYGSISQETSALSALPFMDVQIGSDSYTSNVMSGNLPGAPVPVYFIGNPGFFHRGGLYQEAGKDFTDNAVRFAFFCKAVLWMIKGLEWTPDIIHCNDWPTALLPVMIKTDAHVMADPDLVRIKTMYTIHNLAYQGMFPMEDATKIGLSYELLQPGALEFYGSINFMKGGLLYADKLTTVSPTYAEEIQTPTFGCGLDGVLRDRAADLTGILNGIDYSQWNPELDQHLPKTYTAGDAAGKAICKAELQKELGLDVKPDVPLLVVISRLDPQKGLDILLPLIPELIQLGVQVAILGTGLAEYHDALEALSKKHTGQMAAQLKFDNGLAHRMEAGADIFLMPSRFEPCGLNQLYSLKYGTLPVVRKTGGLADSVEPVSTDGTAGTGFVFEEYSGSDLMTAIQQALDMYKDKAAWAAIQLRAMNQDFSWTASARRYAEIYDMMIK